MFLWIDMAFDDCCAVLLLPFTRNNYGVLCGLCNACCGGFYPDKTQYHEIQPPDQQNQIISKK
eukprot:UN13639